MMISVISNFLYFFLFYPFDVGKEKTVNILRLNQQEIIQSSISTTETNYEQTSNGNASKPIFSLSPNVSRDDIDGPTTNQHISSVSVEQRMSSHLGNDLTPQSVSRNNNIIFCPKKFVPAQKKHDIAEEKMVLESKNVSNNDKIKPKWSPGVTSQEDEPKYKKIQPIFQKPKSPHKIT